MKLYLKKRMKLLIIWFDLSRFKQILSRCAQVKIKGMKISDVLSKKCNTAVRWRSSDCFIHYKASWLPWNSLYLWIFCIQFMFSEAIRSSTWSNFEQPENCLLFFRIMILWMLRYFEPRFLNHRICLRIVHIFGLQK